MSILVNESKEAITIQEGATAVAICIPREVLPEFKHAMFRAFNTWQNPSHEMRAFYESLVGRTNMYPPKS